MRAKQFCCANKLGFFPNYGDKFLTTGIDLSMKNKQDIRLQHEK